MFPVHNIDPRFAVALEPLGTKRKFWFRRDGERFLFKAEERGTGEDWAEKVTCELAALLGLPHVHYDLARRADDGTPGVICRSCAELNEFLVHGNQLLWALDPEYPAEDRRQYKVRAHTLDAVGFALQLILPPDPRWCPSLPTGIATAFDCFVGYVMLDAWVANQDRHHENWGALFRDGKMHLAPTFDHGASMARNLTDEDRHERMTSRDRNRSVEVFATKARSAFFAAPAATKALTTFAAWEEFSGIAPETAILWLERLRAISPGQIEALLKEVPPGRMSSVCRDFTLKLLLTNQARLLEGEEE